MKKLDYAVIIPARYASSRLAGKPLVELRGVPMIVRTYRQCIKAVSAEHVFVATDDTRIAEVCYTHGMNVLMTSEHCMTGTDRLVECLNLVDTELFINVQGDEPVISPQDILTMIEAAKRFPGEILNGVCELTCEEQFKNTSVPKVVMREDGRLLYMSRAPIPTTKSATYIKGWRQVCVYTFPRQALSLFGTRHEKTPLEAIEDIEILRFIELGIEVRMIPLSNTSVAVDLMGDVERVEEVIDERGL